MAEPAVQLAPGDEVAGEAAAEQTKRLVLIQGGKSATATAEGGATAEALETGILAGAGAVLAGIAVGLAILLWPSEIAPDPPMPPRASGDSEPESSTPEVPDQAKGEVKAECPLQRRCPPHQWVIIDPGKKPEESMAELQKRADNLQGSPSRAAELRGVEFEKNAMDLNGRTRKIEATNRTYKCAICGQVQEVDILFENGQIAEAKSRNFKGVKASSKQGGRLSDLQSSLNQQNNTDFKPLAKLDDSLPDADKSAEKYDGRGFEVERLDTRVKGQ